MTGAKKRPSWGGGLADADGTSGNPYLNNTTIRSGNQHDAALAAVLALEKWAEAEKVVAEAFRKVAGELSPEVDEALQVIESGRFLTYPGAVARLRLGYAHILTHRTGTALEDYRRYYAFAARVFRESGILREEGAA